jgi:hypothetical protein
VIAVLLSLALFAFWWLVGLGVYALLRVDTSSLRIALAAPALGAATSILGLFVFSHAGVGLEAVAAPLAIALAAVSSAVIAWRRLRLPWGVVPVVGVCIGGLLLAGWPMLTFGLNWIANANDDMANYVLSATDLRHHGLLDQPNAAAIAQDRDYSSLLGALHASGARPGPDLALAAFASVLARPAYQTFMPFISALHMSTISATAALALQATRRTAAAIVAAVLLAVSPLTTFGVVQQLLGQVAGLALAAAFFAVLARPELHRGSRPPAGELAVVSILATALFVAYVELAAIVACAYAAYVLVLGLRRELSLRAVAWLWLVPIAVAALVLNKYAITELRFVGSQTQVGVGGTTRGFLQGPPAFGFSMVPSALTGIVGFHALPVVPNTRLIGTEIVLAALLLAAALVVSLLYALRGVAAAVVVVVFAVFAIFLGAKSSDYGLFKLYMYVQPFLAATVAVWLVQIRRRALVAAAVVGLVLLLPVEASTQRTYVRASRSPLALRHGSDSDILPAFSDVARVERQPVISVTENPTLGKLEAVSVAEGRLLLLSQNLFSVFMDPDLTAANGWRRRAFRVFRPQGEARAHFWESTHATAALASMRCLTVLPSGTQSVANRRSLPDGAADLSFRPCPPRENTLVFVSSDLGQGYYDFRRRHDVAFYPVEPDVFFPPRTMSAFGRYALFRVLRPSSKLRVVLDLSRTFIHDGSNLLPLAAIEGRKRFGLSLVGRGSARVFSQALQPQEVAGQSYVMLDLGTTGRLVPIQRRGLEKLWGESVPLDPRYVTAFVRDISLVTEAQYRALLRPASLTNFPASLGNPNLEYSGIYEDGWVAEHSYAVLRGGPAGKLILHAAVPALPSGDRLRVTVNGRTIADRAVEAGELTLVGRIPASSGPRRVDLRWDRSERLPAPDERPVAALVHSLEIRAP